jgi:ribose 5-phosphate isomerase B
MKIYLAADHAGLNLKDTLLDALAAFGHEAVDLGAYTLDPNDDYPDLITPCAARVAAEQGSMGIVIGGSGHGEAMAANRLPGVRTATFYGPRPALAGLESEGTAGTDEYDIVRVSRMHNDANILSIGARFVSESEAIEAARIFIETPFSQGAHHERRISKF